MKRVYCLYRVSTKKQVDKNQNDIPMQRIACHEFMQYHPDWTILKEFEEKGVSGFKISAENRDAIQELKKAAERKEFDVLLVFMFDRLGRIDSETPFVVEWFVKQGIEVWSVKEGEQRFENQTDRLVNFLRFWSANGESTHTSQRVSTAMRQMILEGLYTGGPLRYGYRLVESGKVNRKGRRIMALEIDPDQQTVIELIDTLTIHNGYGGYRTANLLNEKGYRTNQGSLFTHSAVYRILVDEFYTGFHEGETSPQLQKLRIRSDETYQKIMHIMNERKRKNEERRHMALTTKGMGMLSGNLFCGHCGGRLTTILYRDQYTRKDGRTITTEMVKYSCYHKARKLTACDGQTSYKASVIDDIVDDIIRSIFQGMEGMPEEEQMRRSLDSLIKQNTVQKKRCLLEKGKIEKQTEKLQKEIGKALLGESLYTEADLAQSLQMLRNRKESLEKELATILQEEENHRTHLQEVIPQFCQFRSWAEEYDQASREQKKMIACHMFQRIEVYKGYKIKVYLNSMYEQLCKAWGDPKVIEGLEEAKGKT